jgi:peptidoglycan-N-acetylglucosamine deacetylase
VGGSRLVGTTLVVVAVAVLGVQPPVAAAPRVDVSAPQYESPGGTVPTIVTVYEVPSGYTAAISARGTNGAGAICAGGVWHNPVRKTASRKCYLQLPTKAGSYNVRGSATLTKSGSPTLTASGLGSRAVLGNGYLSSNPMPMDRIREIERCFNPTSRVWLTFDDGGSSSQVTSILGTLKRKNVKGRFFFRGDWAERNASLMRQIAADGHLLANHTHSHPPLSQASSAEVDRQIAKGVQATTSPKLLRPPFAAGALTTRLESLAAKRGYRLCRWTMDT